MENKFSGICETISGIGATSAIKGQGNWELETRGIWTGKLYIEKSEDGGLTWSPAKIISSNGEYNVSLTRTAEKEVMLRARAFEWTSGTCEITMQFSVL